MRKVPAKAALGTVTMTSFSRAVTVTWLLNSSSTYFLMANTSGGSSKFLSDRILNNESTRFICPR